MIRKYGRWLQIEYGCQIFGQLPFARREMRDFQCYSLLVEPAPIKVHANPRIVFYSNFSDSFTSSWQKRRDRYWSQLVVIEPQGDPETEFLIGFHLPFQAMTQIMISSSRKIKDGPYAMLYSFDCQSFLLATDPAGLLISDCFFIGSEKCNQRLTFY